MSVKKGESEVLIQPREILIILPKSFEQAGYMYLKRKFKEEGLHIRGVSSPKPPNRNELRSLVRGVEGYISGWGERIDKDIIARANKLKIIAEFGVGVDNIDLGACTREKIIVTNTPHANIDAVKEFTIALILSLARRICKVNENTKRGTWELTLGTQVKNKTLGVVGTGNIGSAVAKTAICLGMNVLAYDIHKNEILLRENKVEYVSLQELFRQADFVSIHLPSTSQTNKLIDRKYLNLMKKSAYLINTARGAVVNEKDLYELLKNKRIAGVAIDVYSQEPPSDSPLLTLSDVITTSHIAGVTFEAIRESARVNFEDVMKVLQGKKPLHVLNTEVI